MKTKTKKIIAAGSVVATGLAVATNRYLNSKRPRKPIVDAYENETPTGI